MIFHENRLLADDSHDISYLIFVENWENISKFVVCCSRDWCFKDKIYILSQNYKTTHKALYFNIQLVKVIHSIYKALLHIKECCCIGSKLSVTDISELNSD